MPTKTATLGYGTGKRKSAIARVWLEEGDAIEVNGREVKEYFGRDVLEILVQSPLTHIERLGRYRVKAIVKGGGLSGQAGAVKLGIARAIVAADPTIRPTLRRDGFLTRDSRVKERKKYGRKKARRGFQFVKR